MKYIATVILCWSYMTTAFCADIRGFRGEVIYFMADPESQKNAYQYYQDGVLYVESGKVLRAGEFKNLQHLYPDATLVDYAGKLIIPRFVDTHVHYPQLEMIAAYASF